MNDKVVTFGEILLRLSPEGFGRFVQARSFDAAYGGGEANVAVSLANFGCQAAFVSRLPEHEIGQAAVNALRACGVDTSHIARGGKRVGIYFLEKGSGMRPSKVIYDREASAMDEAGPEDFDWDKIFEGKAWFHFSGITPALGKELAGICLTACKKAKEKGLTTSCDFNFRAKLWDENTAGRVMEKLCRYVDVFYGISHKSEAEKMFGIHFDRREPGGREYEEVAEKLSQKFGFRKVFVSIRGGDNFSQNRFSAMLYENGTCYYSQVYDIPVVDRVGSGDAFGAGLIYGCLKNFTPKDTIEFAAAAGCLKLSIEGDASCVSEKEVLGLVKNKGNTRVLR